MKQFLLLSALACLTAAQSTQDFFQALCSEERTGGTKRFPNGIIVDYYCNEGPVIAEATTTMPNINSPADCAKLCADAKGQCKSSVWLYAANACQLQPTAGKREPATGSLTMVLTGQNAAAGAGDVIAPLAQPAGCGGLHDQYQQCVIKEGQRECKDDLSKCEKGRQDDAKKCKDEKDDLKHKLKKCSEHGEGQACCQDLANCKDKVDRYRKQNCELLDRLANCQTTDASGNGNLLLAEIEMCPDIDSTQRTVGGVTYTIYCNRGIKEDTLVAKEQELAFNQCVAACSKDATCQGINYYPANDKPCVMYQSWANTPTAAGTRIMIAAIPVAKK
ncbi:hypothetical protein BDV25DRAFT_137558 [Aspergillus avenaceus]|uniref:Apple domain-containing protein n=1 Tax=Aspergillus avenaceus TaxID=36643 RepID=A0A5N6U2K1_ASPAV|nr:hypothetical protein BDV25DRAFT_137558 [Aspergillus avenaceus]